MPYRFKKVQAGQADGIQPRTIEVFKVSETQYNSSSRYLFSLRVMESKSD